MVKVMKLVLTLLLSFTLNVSVHAQEMTHEQLALSCVLMAADLAPAECSTLEFEVHGIDADGRYAALIVRTHAGWLQQRDATASAWDHIHYLNIFNALNNCSIDDATFKECQGVIDDPVQACMAQGNYTTVAMGRCASLESNILGLVLTAEIALLTAIEADFTPVDDFQPHPIEALSKAQEAWETFVKAECDREYWRYQGTMAGLISISCHGGYRKKRIEVINSENRFDDRDVNALDIQKVLSSMAF